MWRCYIGKARHESIRMKHTLKILSLLLLLLTAQQAAVVHELSHLSGAGGSQFHVDSGNAGSPCALCPAFAQASSPAFSHSFQSPSLVRAAPEPATKPLFAVIEAAAPTARSRGPPV
jgi:hypothetical protein